MMNVVDSRNQMISCIVLLDVEARFFPSYFAISLSILMGHYSGFFPTPFRLCSCLRSNTFQGVLSLLCPYFGQLNYSFE